jgi:hypothetical protein
VVLIRGKLKNSAWRGLVCMVGLRARRMRKTDSIVAMHRALARIWPIRGNRAIISETGATIKGMSMTSNVSPECSNIAISLPNRVID